MCFGLIIIAGLIANLHVAVFYVFFIFMLPYIAEYLIVCLRDSFFVHKLKIHIIKKKIENETKKGASEQKIENLQLRLAIFENDFEGAKEKLKEKQENPYRLKLVKRDSAKWLLVIVILCFAMGLLTPIGDEPYTHIFKLMSGDTTRKHIRTYAISTISSFRNDNSTFFNIWNFNFYRHKNIFKRFIYAIRVNNYDIYVKKAIFTITNNRSYFCFTIIM